MGWLDSLFGGIKRVAINGVSLPAEGILNLVTTTTVTPSAVDSPSTTSTNVTLTSGGRPVFRVAGTGTVTTSGRQSTTFCDPGGGTPGTPVVTIFTSAPQDGDEALVVDTTKTINGTTQTIGVSAGGAPIEDPKNPGNFVSGTVYLTVKGASGKWSWDATLGHANLL